MQQQRDQHRTLLLCPKHAAASWRAAAGAAVAAAAAIVRVVNAARGALDGGRVELIEHLNLRYATRRLQNSQSVYALRGVTGTGVKIPSLPAFLLTCQAATALVCTWPQASKVKTCLALMHASRSWLENLALESVEDLQAKRGCAPWRPGGSGGPCQCG